MAMPNLIQKMGPKNVRSVKQIEESEMILKSITEHISSDKIYYDLIRDE